MKFYLTFGNTHKHKVADTITDGNTVLSFDATDYETARKIAFAHFGPKFCFIYEEGHLPEWPWRIIDWEPNTEEEHETL